MKTLPYIIILALIIVIFFQRSCVKPQPAKPTQTVVTKTDTVYIQHTDTVPSYVPVPKVIVKHDTSYKVSDNLPELKAKYIDLASKYYAGKLYRDTLKLDTIGQVYVQDSVIENSIISRIYSYKYRLPINHTTTVITKEVAPKTQFYIGGEIVGQKETLLQGAYVGVLLKNKKDQIFGLKGGLDINGKPLVGVSSYWKIKFHK